MNPLGLPSALDPSLCAAVRRRENTLIVQLSPPRLITFVASLVLAVLAFATMYTRVPMVGHYVAGHRIWFLVAAYAVLAVGVMSRSHEGQQRPPAVRGPIKVGFLQSGFAI